MSWTWEYVPTAPTAATATTRAKDGEKTLEINGNCCWQIYSWRPIHWRTAGAQTDADTDTDTHADGGTTKYRYTHCHNKPKCQVRRQPAFASLRFMNFLTHTPLTSSPSSCPPPRRLPEISAGQFAIVGLSFPRSHSESICGPACHACCCRILGASAATHECLLPYISVSAHSVGQIGNAFGSAWLHCHAAPKPYDSCCECSRRCVNVMLTAIQADLFTLSIELALPQQLHRPTQNW